MPVFFPDVANMHLLEAGVIAEVIHKIKEDTPFRAMAHTPELRSVLRVTQVSQRGLCLCSFNLALRIERIMDYVKDSCKILAY